MGKNKSPLGAFMNLRSGCRISFQLSQNFFFQSHVVGFSGCKNGQLVPIKDEPWQKEFGHSVVFDIRM